MKWRHVEGSEDDYRLTINDGANKSSISEDFENPPNSHKVFSWGICEDEYLDKRLHRRELGYDLLSVLILLVLIRIFVEMPKKWCECFFVSASLQKPITVPILKVNWNVNSLNFVQIC